MKAPPKPSWLATCSCGWERECSSEWAARSVSKLHPQLAPMDVDANLRDALQWEKEHGFRTDAEITLLQQQEEHVPAATVVILQESQEPTADPNEDGPARFVDPIPFLSSGIDLSQYFQFKSQSPAHRKPAVSATERSPKTLSEVDLIEARTQLYHAAAGGGRVAKLPADIHARLFHAIVG